MTELEELERREIMKRHNEDMIRRSATRTGTSAQLLRALNQSTSYTPTQSLAGSTTDDVDELIADHAHALSKNNAD